MVPRTPTGSIFAAWQPLRMSRRSWARVTDFKTRVLRLKPEVQILGSSKSIRHTKVEIPRLKSCFLRKKETKLNANHWKRFSTELSVGVRDDGFTLFCLMICIWHANRVPDPVPCGQPCRTWIKNVWCLSSLITIPRTFMMYLHHLNSLESVNDVVYNSVKIFFTGFFCVYRECVSVKLFILRKVY